MSVEEYYSALCDGCSSYNCSPVICEECVGKKVEEERKRVLKIFDNWVLERCGDGKPLGKDSVLIDGKDIWELKKEIRK